MNENKTETIGEKIRRLRLQKGMSQGELADGFVTISMISQLERDKNTASVELLQHIARKLQIQLHELVRNEVDQMELYNRHKLAKIYLDIRQPEFAKPLLLFLREQSELSYADQLEVMIDLAECLNQQGEHDAAIELLDPIVIELEKNFFDDIHVLASMRKQIGNAHYSKSEYTKAYYNYHKAFDLIGRFSDNDQQSAYIAFNLGQTLRKLGQHQQSLFYLERAQRYFQNTQDVRRVADTLFANGLVYYDALNQKQAAEMFQQAHVLYTGLNMIEWAVKVQHNVATFITPAEDKDAAIEELKKCADFYQTESDHKNHLLVLAKLADLNINRQQEEAIRNLKLAEEVASKHTLEETEEYASYVRVSAKFNLCCKRYEESIRNSLNSAAIFAKLGMVAEQVDSLEIAVDAYRGLGKHESALDLERERNVLLGKLYRREVVR
ncbi:hypothetical protein CBW65_11330 [Tumebacillus avium]|uniref:HTH cro/C1-type domain-containing protein n=1 Tax=Tumebacillus avium TaxID=1903704 RepID=A0A1Y0IPZ3_9BACL|nr:helix-turn-helix transcriptional regulator [Tumebacillus avium]ARU61535.1 hypothetical protein CBW65_11330 [Tumebacillus avium]